jgi:hypothetical protein
MQIGTPSEQSISVAVSAKEDSLQNIMSRLERCYKGQIKSSGQKAEKRHITGQ